MDETCAGQRWKHFKGAVYTIKTIARNTETGERMVIYGNYLGMYARPLSMWHDVVTNDEGVEVPRFTRIAWR